jgi:hypothetical protein
MNVKLPLGFIEQLAPLLGSELPSFVASYEEEACRGLRMRPGFPKPEDAQEAVPWAENAFRVPFESTDGAMIAHEAGAYYMQEPSAMAAVAALNGWGALIILAAGSLTGAVAGIIISIRNRKKLAGANIRFAPWLGAGYLFWCLAAAWLIREGFDLL